MIRADHARRTLREHTDRLCQTATDTTLPDPADTDGERLLLATATAHPDNLGTMRWLQPDDFALPLHGRLYQCLTALAYRGAAIDPVTVLWEAQHRQLLTADIAPADLMALVSNPVGAPEYWGERMLRRALLGQAHTVSLRLRGLTDDPANTAHQLITGSRRALADLSALRARWQHTSSWLSSHSNIGRMSSPHLRGVVPHGEGDANGGSSAARPDALLRAAAPEDDVGGTVHDASTTGRIARACRPGSPGPMSCSDRSPSDSSTTKTWPSRAVPSSRTRGTWCPSSASCR